MEFNRIIKLLRKERGITQKQAAEDLGVSQALLSHYEKGIRECGLDFVVRVADYYNVSCDYLLGRSAERNGMMLSAEDLPNPEKMKDNVYHGSVLPTMNKKLISNSLNVLYAKIGHRRVRLADEQRVVPFFAVGFQQLHDALQHSVKVFVPHQQLAEHHIVAGGAGRDAASGAVHDVAAGSGDGKVIIGGVGRLRLEAVAVDELQKYQP